LSGAVAAALRENDAIAPVAGLISVGASCQTLVGDDLLNVI
jgi:hypothetical protein